MTVAVGRRVMKKMSLWVKIDGKVKFGKVEGKLKFGIFKSLKFLRKISLLLKCCFVI